MFTKSFIVKIVVVFGILVFASLSGVSGLGPLVKATITDSLVGTWINVDPDGGLVKLIISQTEGRFQVQGFGKCHPTDCDWGKTSLDFLGTDVSDKTPDSGIATWNFGFMDSTLHIVKNNDQLLAQIYNVFKDNSGRENYWTSDQLKKQTSVPGNPGQAESGFDGRVFERLSSGDIGSTISNVEITFVAEDGSFSKSAVSGANGSYRIELPTGRYRVSTSRSGYRNFADTNGPGFFVNTGDGFQTGNIFLEKQQTSTEQEDIGWVGTYEGRLDGRQARLTVSMNTQATSESLIYGLILEDLDRKATFRGTAGINPGVQQNVLENITLTAADGRVATLGKLFLHTWNKDYISGYSIWKGREFGLAFGKAGVQSPAGSGERLDASRLSSQWSGSFDGRLDGRKSRLNITQSSGQNDSQIFFDVVLQDLDRNVTFAGTATVSLERSLVNVMVFPAPLRSTDGKEKNVQKLYLHGSDVNYISGFDEWRGKNFGLLFSRNASDIDGTTSLGIPMVAARVGAQAVTFSVNAVGVAEANVQVYGLDGSLIFDSGLQTAGRALRWNMLDDQGQRIVNGVYLYVVTVRDRDGELVRSGIKKMILLR